MFVDASALCAILLDEPERSELEAKLGLTSESITSPIAVWETVRAMVREIGVDADQARARLAAYLEASGVQMVAIGSLEAELALDAMIKFGKGRHPAQLNMGDCFAYACAKANATSLLFKGDDFSRTDIPSA